MRLLAALAASPWLAAAIQVQVTSQDSVKSAMSEIATDMMSYYTGNQPGQVPGLLPGSLACDPNQEGIYCWWEAGAMWGSLINYWQYTGDAQYNDKISQSLEFQRGPDNNFNPPNQSKSMGIDDQAFWGFSALDAVECNFPEAGGDQPSWLALAQAVYNFQKTQWDDQTCGGGFHWQVFRANPGWNLKNTVSNGGNFLLSARLAYITGNSSYADWAEKVYDWTSQSKLFQRTNGILYIWDNTNSNNGCVDVTNFVWSYNYGLILAGAAYMYNHTQGAQKWADVVNEVLDSTFKVFFPSNNIMKEVQCEDQKNCDQDQKSFKAYLARWMAVTGLLVPSTMSQIMPALQASAAGAAGQCDGGSNGQFCGMQWTTTTWDGTQGVGQQMAALSVLGSTLINQNMVPLTKSTGANSTGDPNAGEGAAANPATELSDITTADKAGASILTILAVVGFIGGTAWIVI